MTHNSPRNKREQVSFDDEPLVVVDEQDRVLGYLDKASCHDGNGVLHRAFSIFIFDSRGRLLIQQRSAGKRLWPLYWSNSCCSHPRKGESLEQAVHRRLQEELGFDTDLQYMYKFSYFARFGQQGSERELCAVYIGQSDGPVSVHPEEVHTWRWAPLEELTREMIETPDTFTPWFRMEWDRLLRDYRAPLAALVGEALPTLKGLDPLQLSPPSAK